MPKSWSEWIAEALGQHLSATVAGDVLRLPGGHLIQLRAGRAVLLERHPLAVLRCSEYDLADPGSLRRLEQRVERLR